MIRPAALLTVLLLGAAVAGAQTPSVSDVAALNADAKRLSDTEPERGLTLARQALDLARVLGDVAGEAEALHNVAVAYLTLGALDLAGETAQASADRYAEAGDGRGEAQGYNTLGLIAADAGDFATAMEHHLRALGIRERIGDREGLSYSYNNLANVYRRTGQYQQSLEYHALALALKLELGDRASEAFSHQNVGLVYQAMGDVPRALEAFQRSLEIREALGDARGIASSLNNIGQIQAIGDPRAALATYERALEFRRQSGDRRGEANTYNSIGQVRLQMREPGAAVAAFQRSLEITATVEAPLLRAEAMRGLSDAEQSRGNYRAALDWLTRSVTLRDQVFNAENAERISRLQAAHDSQRQAQRIALLERDGALRAVELEREALLRYALVVVLALVAVSLALLYARYRLKHRAEAELRVQAAELKAALDRVQTLRGLLPICASCKNIRDDNGYWTQVEAYVAAHSSAEFTHSICPDCAEKLYPGVLEATRTGRQ